MFPLIGPSLLDPLLQCFPHSLQVLFIRVTIHDSAPLWLGLKGHRCRANSVLSVKVCGHGEQVLLLEGFLHQGQDPTALTVIRQISREAHAGVGLSWAGVALRLDSVGESEVDLDGVVVGKPRQFSVQHHPGHLSWGLGADGTGALTSGMFQREGSLVVQVAITVEGLTALVTAHSAVAPLCPLCG